MELAFTIGMHLRQDIGARTGGGCRVKDAVLHGMQCREYIDIRCGGIGSSAKADSSCKFEWTDHYVGYTRFHSERLFRFSSSLAFRCRPESLARLMALRRK